MIIIVTDRYKTILIKRIFDILIKFGLVIIVIDMVVVNTTSYNTVLKNDFLTKIEATLNYNAKKLQIKSKRRCYEILINLKKGIRLKMVNSLDEEQDIYMTQPTD